MERKREREARARGAPGAGTGVGVSSAPPFQRRLRSRRVVLDRSHSLPLSTPGHRRARRATPITHQQEGNARTTTTLAQVPSHQKPTKTRAPPAPQATWPASGTRWQSASAGRHGASFVDRASRRLCCSLSPRERALARAPWAASACNPPTLSLALLHHPQPAPAPCPPARPPNQPEPNPKNQKRTPQRHLRGRPALRRPGRLFRRRRRVLPLRFRDSQRSGGTSAGVALPAAVGAGGEEQLRGWFRNRGRKTGRAVTGRSSRRRSGELERRRRRKRPKRPNRPRRKRRRPFALCRLLPLQLGLAPRRRGGRRAPAAHGRRRPRL